MAVPKKRTGKSAQATRRANWKASKPEVVTCPNCGEFALAHTVCTACGYYKGKPVSIKDAQAVEVAEEKKPAKKTTKKTTAKAEKAVEEVKAEETTAEVKEEAAEEKKPAKKTTKKTTAKTTAKTTKKEKAE